MKMKFWKKTSALLKDKNSIYLAKLSRKTSFRHPELEEAIIKATSHDDSSVDYKNAQRIFTWIRASPKFLKPAIWALSTRMDKTKSWIVAIKGLMLMHGIFCCKVPSVQKICRIPFDFSNFIDGYSNSPRMWGLSAFIRAYFAFLDQKSVLLGVLEEEEGGGEKGKKKEKEKEKDTSMVETLERLQKSQGLLDLLLQVKPHSHVWAEVLVLEAMDCIVIEIFDVYSKICNAIAGVLVRIYAANQVEAEMALNVLHKATSQGDDLDAYFDFCRDIGVLNAAGFPTVERVPEEDIRDLERIIHGISEKQEMEKMVTLREDSMTLLKTIITDNWVVFDDEFKANQDPFAASMKVPPPDNEYANANGGMQMQQYYSSIQGGNQGNLLISI